MTNPKDKASAKSSCCGADVHYFNEIGLTLPCLCKKCNQPCDLSGIGGKSDGTSESSPVTSGSTIPVQSAPDEGKMERIIKDAIPMIRSWKRQDAILQQEPGAGTAVELLISHLHSLQSRLKQAEAERDSYRKDAKMLDSFVKTLTDRIAELSWYDKRDHDAVKALIRNTALSSLSNQYPSSR